MPKLDNKTDLTRFLRQEIADQSTSANRICLEAGVSVNAIYMMERRRSVSLPLVIALLNTLGYRLEIVPDTIDNGETGE